MKIASTGRVRDLQRVRGGEHELHQHSGRLQVESRRRFEVRGKACGLGVQQNMTKQWILYTIQTTNCQPTTLLIRQIFPS